MRKHSPRKWLHAILDLLPVIIIPIFAIYSHRHTIDSYEVTRDKYQVLDFNQKWNVNDLVETSYSFGSLSINEHKLNFDFTSAGGQFNGGWFLSNCIEGHKYFLRSTYDNSISELSFFGFCNGYYLGFNLISTCSFTGNYDFHLYYPQPVSQDVSISFYVNLFDLTQMFGSGNEPTIQEFNEMFPNDYYDYTTSKKVLVQNGTETLNNTDIGSQFVYALYTPIHDYFNLTQVGVFGDLYNWLQLNMFNGTAPISIFIVYHVILYEFIMDLIFLIYCVFMFVIDFTERLLDSLFDKSFGGGK